jgi:transcriptional regulator with XRE-family HTH domain
MPQPENLSEKIKSTRKSLKLTQQEFCNRLSEALKRPISRGLVARWEGTSAGSRIIPSIQQLKAIAGLTQKPWEQFLWFMDDEAPANRGFMYHPDGTRLLEPLFPDDQIQAMYDDLRLSSEASPEPWLAELIESDDVQGLVAHFKKINEKEKSEGIKSKDTKLDFEAEQNMRREQLARRQKSNENSAENSPGARITPVLNTFADIGAGFMVSPLDSGARDMFALLQKSTNEENPSERVEKRERFEQVVQWKLENDFGLEKTLRYFQPTVIFGTLRMRPSYFDGESLIQIQALRASYSYRILGMRLKDALGSFFTIEKMQRRVFKKLLIIATYESQIEGHKLYSSKIESVFASEVEVFGELGVSIKFACGPEETAAIMAHWITTPRSELSAP